MSGAAGGFDLEPEDAAFLDDNLIFGGRAEHQRIGLDDPFLAEEGGSLRAEAFLVAGEHEDQAPPRRPAQARDFAREPQMHRG